MTFYSIIVGVLKADCVPFLISIRNTPEAISNLLYLTKCTTILSSSDAMTEGLVAASIKLFEESTDTKIHCIPAPSFVQLYGPNVVPTSAPVMPKKSIEEVMNAPCVLSHSSGTTSLPKPIMLTHRMISQVGFRNRTFEELYSGRMLTHLQVSILIALLGVGSCPPMPFLCSVGSCILFSYQCTLNLVP